MSNHVSRSFLLCSVLFAGLNILASELPQDSGLFPVGSTVVLLTGLAGDVESEQAYRDELAAWLQLVKNSRATAKVFVLSDNPDGLSAQGGIPAVETLKADRASFLALGPKLAAATNSLVVIAWGHGGLQGNTPVLHVHGPRLKPEDFLSLAEQAQGRASRWVLLFRGSGAFAQSLSGGEREILASEATTMFGSDPVGMSLLLKLVRGKPSLSFGALSDAFGRVTAAWYNERNLARTEDPALWRGTEGPRRLAPASTEDSVAANSKPKGSNETEFAEQKSAEEGEKQTPRNEAANPDGIWKEITRVDPAKYPDSEGIVLRRNLSYTFGSNPAISSEQEEFIQILAPEGKHLGDYDISYSPPFEDISFLDCEVLSPEGKLARLDPDSIGEAREKPVGDYQSEHRKVFSLPGVVPGAVLHVRYRTQWKTFPLPHVSIEIPVIQELPIAAQTIEVHVPRDAPFHFLLDEPAPNLKGALRSDLTKDSIKFGDPDIQQRSYSTTYHWRFADLPARSHELLALPTQEARLLVSTFPDWASFSDWYARISQLADEPTPELQAKAAELTKDAKSDREKVLAIYNYVTRLRYVAVPMGVNSFRPHAAAHVFENQFGDCKDKANLFNTLLRTLQIKADLVLVPRFSQAHDDIPGLAFNHAISRVTLAHSGASEILWVDTTDEVCRFGLLPPGDPGRRVLVIDGHTHRLIQLPTPDSREHRLTLHGQVNCSATATVLPLKLTATTTGYPDYELRAAAEGLGSSASHSEPLLAAKFRPIAGSFAMEKQNATAVSALDENFSWQAEGSAIGTSSLAAGKWILQSPFWVPREWDLALHRRNSGLFLNQGYPLTLEEQFEFTLPSDLGPNIASSIPEPRENQQGPLKWRVRWTRAADEKLTAQFSAQLELGELAPAETVLVQQELSDLLAALGASASINLPQIAKHANRQ